MIHPHGSISNKKLWIYLRNNNILGEYIYDVGFEIIVVGFYMWKEMDGRMIMTKMCVCGGVCAGWNDFCLRVGYIGKRMHFFGKKHSQVAVFYIIMHKSVVIT